MGAVVRGLQQGEQEAHLEFGQESLQQNRVLARGVRQHQRDDQVGRIHTKRLARGQ